MVKYLLAVLGLFQACHLFGQATNLQCEYRKDPLGINTPAPRLSWELSAASQQAYQVIVSDDPAVAEGNIWNSGKVQSAASIQIAFKGKKLDPAKTYYWKVKTWDAKGKETGWSNTAFWQMGLLQQADWQQARWIGYDKMPDTSLIIPAAHGSGKKEWGPGKSILPLLRKEFSISKPLKRATMFISGLGHFDMSLNGEKVGDHFLDPGWTQYSKQALYITFDLTPKIKQGKNALGVMLGNGFYHIPRERYRKLTGSYGYPKMICRMLLQFEDGTTQNIVSDTDWKTAPGPITYSSIYGGESYDARLEQPGWNKPGFNDQGWKAAVPVSGSPQLTGQIMDPLKVTDILPTKKITHPAANVWIYDVAQNASGIPRIKVKGKSGDVIKIIPGELLDDSGKVTQQASGGPMYYTYIIKGTEAETWQPQFTYYGYRYLQIEGAVPANENNPSQLPVMLAVDGLHTHHAAASAGDFSCSSELFNNIYHLIDWAIRSNLASVLTDCPHREKLGWLEEVHLMGNSIRYNYQVPALLDKITNDMRDAQTADALVPDIAPEYVEFGGGFRNSAEWGSASVLVPWDMYRWYGDKRVLEESYSMMARYIEFLGKNAEKDSLKRGLGDWFDIGPKGVGESQNTPIALTAFATYYHDVQVMIATAKVLGKQQDVLKYEQLSASIKKYFNDVYLDKATGQYATGSQTSNTMALYMDLVPSAQKEKVLQHIIDDIVKRDNSLTTGEIGFGYLLRLLNNAGRSDLIYTMNNRKDVPGYGFQLANGATALTESWQAYRFVSNNHLMLGHLMEWFYSGLAGIGQEPGSIAFKKILIRPQPVGDITFAKASYHSPYGLIKSEWHKNDSTFNLQVQIPPNTTATIHLPAIGKGKVVADNTLRFIKKENNILIYETGPGKNNISVR
ncbi:Bacterial alpha-L-rhamnosidase [Chitinophaga sp. SYP-B3965]|uniref:family 78 glycoside hydrolase catalytic domain n=1 Tax=Chitinophaga sp. SYP-B3965 TaxID=2663120 RepID=UPI0012999133|nr:family 78 glycoside hydrolase catalytic domain [Chitinophaga sp. SYP-B3965]MRG43684.1 Bacterial alpha-L-rhamnosidase [Chitinophaga sp. SYP-B3965]